MKQFLVVFLLLAANLFAAPATSIKPSALSAITNGEIASNDLFLVYDLSAGITKKLTASQLDARYAAYASYLTALTGDVAASGPGSAVATIQAGAITNAKVNATAAIAYSKLNLAGSVVNADVATGAAIAYSKLNLAGSVVNADVATGAAIARSKIAAGTALRVLHNDGSGFPSETSGFTYNGALLGVATTTPLSVVHATGNSSAFWNGTTWSGNPYSATSYIMENSRTGGYDSTFFFRQTTSTGVGKTSFGLGVVGVSSWDNADVATQISDVYFVSRNAADGFTERFRLTSTGFFKSKAVLQLEEQGSKPSNPPSGYANVYPKSDGFMYWTDDSGTEKLIHDSTTWSPSAANDACTAGRLGCNSTHCHYCVSSGVIKRWEISTWP